MKITPGHVVALVLGIGALVAFDRWSTREDRWKERLAVAVTTARTTDSVQHVRDSLRHIADSIRVDSLLAVADSEETRHIRLAQDNGRLRVQLANARTMPDTVRVQAGIIANQDSIIRSDSGQKATLRATVASQRETIVDLNTSLVDARRRLADLIQVADRPPKELKFLGLNLSLKPYLGVGLNLSPRGKADYGVQLGVSVLRG